MSTLALSLIFFTQVSTAPVAPPAAEVAPAETAATAPTAHVSYTNRSAQAAAATEAEQRQAGRPLVCRNEPVIGTRFRERRCRPADMTPHEENMAADQLRRQQTSAQNVMP